MNEIQRNLMSKDNKTMIAYPGANIREIVRFANDEGIKREDIVSLLNNNGQYILVYYK